MCRQLERKRRVHVMGGADPLIRLIRGAWDLYRGKPASGELEACVESPAAAQITVSTVHKAKGLEWPRVLMSSDFNRFVELEGDKPVIDLEEAYIMYVAVTRARKKLPATGLAPAAGTMERYRLQ